MTPSPARPAPPALDLDAIRARLDAITPGEWFSDTGPYNASMRIYVGDGDVLLAECEKKYNPNYFNDADFMAEAPRYIRALVAEVEAARAFKARVEAWRDKSLAEQDLADAPGLWYDAKMWKEIFNDTQSAPS